MPLHKVVSEKIEIIQYRPDKQDTGDLEPGTRTITATLEASGIANADYSKALTFTIPTDSRLELKRVACQLYAVIDSIPAGDTNLYCRVYVDAQDADHLLFDENWDSTGAKVDAVDTHAGAKATIFNILKSGVAHTLYFFFWKAGTGTGIVLSQVLLYEAVATCTTSTYGVELLRLIHTGLVSIGLTISRYGTGTGYLMVLTATDDPYYGRRAVPMANQTGDFGTQLPFTTDINVANSAALIKDLMIATFGTVSTDLNAIYDVNLVLRSEQ